MEKKGIFVNVDESNYKFKYNAFLEFFIAKGMMYDDSFKSNIPDNILQNVNIYNFNSLKKSIFTRVRFI